MPLNFFSMNTSHCAERKLAMSSPNVLRLTTTVDFTATVNSPRSYVHTTVPSMRLADSNLGEESRAQAVGSCGGKNISVVSRKHAANSWRRAMACSQERRTR